jgi:hypothetical protein
MRSKAPAALGMLLLFLSVPPAKAETGSGPLVASSLSATADLGGDGGFVGSSWSSMAVDEGIPLGRTALRASKAHVLVEHNERRLVVDDLSLLPGEDSAAEDSYTDLAVAFSEMSTDARILVLPRGPTAPTLLLDRVPMVIDQGPGATLRYEHRAAGGQPEFEVDATGAFEVRPDAPAMATVQGDLRVVVTGFLLALEAADGSASADTRRQQGPLEPSGTARRTSSTEAIFDLEDAVVTVPMQAIQLSAATLTAHGSLHLQGAQGTFSVGAGRYDLEGQDADLEGSPRAQVSRAEHGQAVELEGRITALAIDGTQVALPVAKVPSPMAMALFLVPFLGLLAGLHVAMGRRRFGRLDAALQRKDYHTAIGLADRFRLHPWFGQDASLAGAIALTELERPAEARDLLRARARWSPRRAGTRDFLLARAAARLGDEVEAVRCLAASLVLDPGLLLQARSDPVLAGLARNWRRRTAVDLEAYA